MSIHSNVAIQCEENAYRMFEKVMNENNFTPTHTNKDEYDGYIVYSMIWNDVQWYEVRPQINGIKNVMRQLDEMHNDEDDGLAYCFIRIGEEREDTEASYNSDNFEPYSVCEECFGE